MKHSIKEKKPKGYSKGKHDDKLYRTGPIMIEDIMSEGPSYHKSDTTIREMVMRTDPTNDTSPIIKRKFKPLDNPAKVLELLQGIRNIKEGITGNNVTTGPLQYQYWRGCLTGTALTRFNMFAVAVGNETLPNLNQVERRFVTFFAPREVLRKQTQYMRFSMRKPKDVSTRQYVGAVSTLNENLTKLPPGFERGQKLPDTDIMDIMASKAPKNHKELMTDHGFDPQTATVDEFVEICERAETKEAIQKRPSKYSSDDDSDNERPSKKAKKKPKHSQSARREYYCREHGPNSTHDSKDCKVLIAAKKENWKKKDNSENKYADYKSKYKKKHAELNLLQMETKKEKAKWTKMYKKLKANPTMSENEASEGEFNPNGNQFRPRRETVREGPDVLNVDTSSSSSSSSSSSDSDSE
jgi:hypothetical protein